MLRVIHATYLKKKKKISEHEFHHHQKLRSKFTLNINLSTCRSDPSFNYAYKLDKNVFN